MLPEATRLASGWPQDQQAPVGRRAERKKAAHALVHELLAQGHSRRAIARHLSWGLRHRAPVRERHTLAGRRIREPDPNQQTGPPQALPGAAICRIKKIKRQLYGRAGFEPLRKMILLQ
ncbi:hypothetical protein [Streptomyces zaomyceticus]|uniref:hypothetical protein n=1 Tax=Streptomyces zaomyceticus TaxID=68286 RepID=UPI00368D915B